MAAPHVAGVVALYLEKNPDATLREVADNILFNTSRWKVTDPGADTTNRLLFSQIKYYNDAYSWMIPVIYVLLL